MGDVRAGQLRYLKLDNLAADPELARRLPPDLAWRCHALPLAEDNGRITIAMADPEDAEAREAVIAELGPKSCLVKGSSLTIDARLAEIWGDDARHHLEVKVCALPEPLPGDLWNYAQALGALLDAHLSRITTESEINAMVKDGARTNCDLIIFGKANNLLIRHLLSRSIAEDVPPSQQGNIPFAILTAQEPRWPLESILLVLCGEDTDNLAVDWVLRLARPSTAAVTALAVVPPMPSMYHGLSRMEQGMAALLATDTALGRQMHLVARRLTEYKVDGTLRLRQGAPDQQIYREVAGGDHDLIIMATRPCQWWLRQLKGDSICSLLNRLDRPVLFVEPTTGQDSGAT